MPILGTPRPDDNRSAAGKKGLRLSCCAFGLCVVGAVMWWCAPAITHIVSGDSSESRDEISIAAGELLGAYELQEFDANAKYRNHVLRVSGVVKRVGRDNRNHPYVVLDCSAPLGVQCFFDNDLADAVNSLKPAEKTTISGKCMGLKGHVVLQDCQFVVP